MNETKSERFQPILNAGNLSNKVKIAAIFGGVLITFIMAICFLTALIMVLDAIPFHHLIAHS